MANLSEAKTKWRTKTCWFCEARVGADVVRCVKCGHYNLSGQRAYDKPLLRLADAVSAELTRVRTGPWDYVFGGGLVETSASLIGAVPGCGKTTMTLQACEKVCEDNPGREALLIASEQLPSEIKTYSDRMLLKNTSRFVVIPTLNGLEELGNLEEICAAIKPVFIGLDSLPGLCGDQHDVAVDMCKVLKDISSKLKAPSFIVDHVTKAKEFAGLMKLQHAVDVVITMDRDDDSGSATGGVRTMRAIKNRFGRANIEILLDMTERGLVPHVPGPEEDEDDDD
jgi:DNA repair protein RadA/Sms